MQATPLPRHRVGAIDAGTGAFTAGALLVDNGCGCNDELTEGERPTMAEIASKWRGTATWGQEGLREL
jgi:hypothetical protein